MHPVLLSLGPLKIPTYGFLMAIGFLVAFNIAIRKAEPRRIDIDKFTNLLFIILFSSIVGSRLVYVGLRWETFISTPLDVFKLWKGGMVFYGGLSAAIVSSLVYCRIAKLPIGVIADVMAPSLALGHVFGRIGCFAYGCCYGIETTCFTGVHFPYDKAGIYRHPTQLYEALAELLIFLLLTFLYKRWCLPIDRPETHNPSQSKESPKEDSLFSPPRYLPGTLLLTYAIVYSSFRFFNEFLRGDNRGGQWLFGLSVSQNGALFLVIASGIILTIMRLSKSDLEVLKE